MAVSTEEILESIGNMSIMQVVELVEKMEKKFNVSAAAAAVAMPMAGAAAGGAAAAEQTEFNVILTGFAADKKVNVIKVVREITGLGLKEAKDLVEGTPANVKEGVSKADSADLKKKLEEAGGTIEVK